MNASPSNWDAIRLLRVRRSGSVRPALAWPRRNRSMTVRSLARVAGSWAAIWRMALSTGPEPTFKISQTDDVAVPMRDGIALMSDIYRPDAEGRFPALLAFSSYPRQIQNLRAPLGLVEAGASDFFVPRGYVHVSANARGTSGSGGTWTLLDHCERKDLFDLIEWIAAQPWCDGNVGILGISYFAMAPQRQPARTARRPALGNPSHAASARHRWLAAGHAPRDRQRREHSQRARRPLPQPPGRTCRRDRH